ncbi:MAG: hypothetical protein ACAF41_24925 [Leptolyngbya sp. BL-A-14]
MSCVPDLERWKQCWWLSGRSLPPFRVGVCAIVMGLLCATIAVANAPAPPAYAWFAFTDAANKPIMVQSVQLAECQTMACATPVLLLEAGTCSASGCLHIAPALRSPSNRFDCAENTCLYVEDVVSDRKTGPYFKLIAQVAERSRVSESFRLSLKSPLESSTSEHLRVIVGDAALAIAPDTRASQPTRLDLFWLAFGLTEITELAVAALVFWQMKVDRPFLIKMLAAIAFINLLTFPVVWFFFPSLQPFQYRSLRVVGALSLAVAIGFGVGLSRLSTVTLKTVGKLFGGWLLSLPLVGLIGFVGLLTFASGEWLPAANGLTASITLPVSEVFAVVVEAWLIHHVSQRRLSLPKAGLLSLLMNAASLILGLVLLPTVQHIR